MRYSQECLKLMINSHHSLIILKFKIKIAQFYQPSHPPFHSVIGKLGQREFVFDGLKHSLLDDPASALHDESP